MLFNDIDNKEDKPPEITVASGKAASIRKAAQDPSVNYLQSNLAALTPENGKPSFEAQTGLSSGRLGAQFTMNKMSKTQETNWVRPNAESELASAMPESSSSTAETSHTGMEATQGSIRVIFNSHINKCGLATHNVEYFVVLNTLLLNS